MKRNSRPRARRGSLTVELAILLPVLLSVVFVFVQIGMMMAATQRLTAASQQGARVAARGGSEKDVADAVRDVLGGGRFEKATIEARLVNPETGMPWQSGEPVEVVVKIAASAALPKPVLVAGSKDELIGRSIVRKE